MFTHAKHQIYLCFIGSLTSKLVRPKSHHASRSFALLLHVRNYGRSYATRTPRYRVITKD